VLKLAATAGVVGGAVALGGALLRATSSRESIEELSAEQNAVLASDAELHGLCVRLMQFGRFHPGSTRVVVEGAVALVEALAQTRARGRLKMSLPRLVASKCAAIVEGVRLLRAHVARRVGGMAGVLEDFDEIAGGLQKVCTDAQFNATMAVQASYG
jgi:hypothetical protein